MRFKGRQYKPRHEWRRCRNVCERCCVFRTLLVFRKHRSLDTDNQVIADDEGRGRGGIEFTYEFQLSDINPSRCTDVQRGRKREGMEMRDVGGRLLLRDSQRSLSHTAESVIGGVCVCACVSQGDSRCNGNRKRDEKDVTGGAYLARDRRDDGP